MSSLPVDEGIAMLVRKAMRMQEDLKTLLERARDEALDNRRRADAAGDLTTAKRAEETVVVLEYRIENAVAKLGAMSLVIELTSEFRAMRKAAEDATQARRESMTKPS